MSDDIADNLGRAGGSDAEVKTALMLQVNRAYAGNDLLTLLELQLQIEQVDASHIANASSQRLKHYNKVLSEQVSELKSEIARVESGFCFEFRVEPRWGINPRKLGALLDQNARHLRSAMAQVERDMRILTDGAATKSSGASGNCSAKPISA